jgi:hypothetical protein
MVIKHLSLKMLDNSSEGPLLSFLLSFLQQKLEFIILAFHALVHNSGLRTESEFIFIVLMGNYLLNLHTH